MDSFDISSFWPGFFTLIRIEFVRAQKFNFRFNCGWKLKLDKIDQETKAKLGFNLALWLSYINQDKTKNNKRQRGGEPGKSKKKKGDQKKRKEKKEGRGSRAGWTRKRREREPWESERNREEKGEKQEEIWEFNQPFIPPIYVWKQGEGTIDCWLSSSSLSSFDSWRLKGNLTS